MPSDSFHQVLILTGPTASGKSALALTLAERLDAEIVSADSMTLYRGLDIGTAKPSPEEQSRVPHHLLDVLDPGESASVAWWLERAAACCADITARGKRPLLVGGTGLYIKAVLCGLFDGPPADEELRRSLIAEAEQLGASALHSRLAAVDPASAARLHPNDVRRVVRALEVWQFTGQPISVWQTQWLSDRGSWIVDRGSKEGDPRSTIHDPRSKAVWLDLPRAELYERINRRVEIMIAQGLVEEVRRLREKPLSREATQALGYKEMMDHLDGRATLEDTIARIQTRSRHFAKRQITWFRHLPGLKPVGPRPTEELTIAAWNLTMKG